MKVWIVFVSTEYDTHFYGAFSTEENAERAAFDYLDANPDGSGRYWEVELDEVAQLPWLRRNDEVESLAHEAATNSH